MAFQISADFEAEKVGAFAGVPAEVYHAAPGESKSMLDVLARSPRDYHLIKTGQLSKPTTDAMEYGQLFHSAILENKTPEELVHIRPDTYGKENKPWHGGALECKKWLAEHTDKPVLTTEEFKQFVTETNYVRRHRHFSLLGAHTELSCFARDRETGYLLKGRFDALQYFGGNLWIIYDVKTTRDASTRAFSAEILKRRYHVQAAQYRRILQRLVPDADIKFCFLAVEKGRFLKMNVKFLATQAMDLGDKVIDENMQLLRRCRISDTWPEWADSEENAGTIDLPEFVYGDKDVLTGMTAASEDEEE